MYAVKFKKKNKLTLWRIGVVAACIVIVGACAAATAVAYGAAAADGRPWYFITVAVCVTLCEHHDCDEFALDKSDNFYKIKLCLALLF